MERSTFLIDQEIKFRKADLEILKDDENYASSWYPVFNLSNVKYCITFSRRSKRKIKHGSYLYLQVFLGRATSVDVDVKISIKDSYVFPRLNGTYNGENRPYSYMICTASELFDAANNYFIDEEMIVKIKGTFKIEFHRIRFPFSVQWKIEESSLKAVSNDCLYSEDYTASADSNINYFIAFYPNGKHGRYNGEACVFLHLALGPHSKVDATWKISVDSVNFEQEVGFTFTDSRGKGVFVFLTEDLFNPENGFFVDGELILNVSGTLMVEKEKEPTLLALENGIVPKGYHRGKNFTINVRGNSFKVHKHVLTSASPVFAGMFESNLKEVKEKNINIKGFKYEIVHAAIKLLYSCSLPQTFTYEQMIDLLQFSDMYAINLIKDPVQDYLIARISPTNVCSLIEATTTFINAPKLLSKCKEYLIKRLKDNEAVHGLDTLDKDIMTEVFMAGFSKIC